MFAYNPPDLHKNRTPYPAINMHPKFFLAQEWYVTSMDIAFVPKGWIIVFVLFSFIWQLVSFILSIIVCMFFIYNFKFYLLFLEIVDSTNNFNKQSKNTKMHFLKKLFCSYFDEETI